MGVGWRGALATHLLALALGLPRLAAARELPATEGDTKPTPAPPEASPPQPTATPVRYIDPPPSDFSGIEMGGLRHTRTGLLLRPTLGVGITHIIRSTEQSSSTEGPTSTSSSLSAVPLEFRGLIGGTITRDVILGGFLGFARSPDAAFSSVEGALSFKDGISMQMVGVQLLYFLDSGSPWQLGTSFAFLNWSAREPGPDGQIPGGTGGLATAEVGYHWWVAQRIELGLLGTFDLGATQTGQTFRISEVLIQSSETSYLIRGGLALVFSYY